MAGIKAAVMMAALQPNGGTVDRPKDWECCRSALEFAAFLERQMFRIVGVSGKTLNSTRIRTEDGIEIFFCGYARQRIGDEEWE